MYDGNSEARPIPDSEAFTGLLGDIVKTLDPWSEADPIAVLASLLSASSVLSQGGMRVYTGGKWQSPLLNVLLFGESAIGRKGTSGAMAFKVITHKEAYPSWIKKHVSYGAPSSGSGLVKRLAGMAIDADHLVPIEEAIATGLIDFDNKGNLIDRPAARLMPSYPAMLYVQEIAKVMHRAKMDDSYDDNIRCMWQGDDLKAKTGNNTEVTLIDPVVAWLAHVTPGEFVAKLGGASLAGGTFNRFMLFWVKRNRVIPREKPIPDSVTAPLAREFRKRIEFAKGIGQIDLNAAAEKFWIKELFPEIDGLLTRSSMWQDFTGRALDNILRMGAIYAAMDMRREINISDLKAARAVQRYVFASLPVVMKELGNDSQTPGRRAVINGNAKEAKPACNEAIKSYLIKNGPTAKGRMTKSFQPTFTGPEIDNSIVFHNGDIDAPYRTGRSGRPMIVLEWIGPRDDDPVRASESDAEPLAVESVPAPRVKASQPRRKAVRPVQPPAQPPSVADSADLLADW